MGDLVVDADGHVVEPRSAWEPVPEEHRPRIERDANGFEHVIVGDKEILGAPLGTLATPGSRFSRQAEFKSLDEAQPGGSDPVARLADMDLEGIDQAVLYPSVGLYFWALADARAAVPIARAYNDWLADYCAADPTRLFGAAMVPAQDPKAAGAELRRAHDDLGFRACFVRPNPCCGRSLSDPAYEAVWHTAEELDVAVGIHEGSSVLLPTLGSDRPFNPLVLHAVSHSFEEMLACAQLIAFGVLERHPNLRIVFLESSGGWAPFWLERLDEQAESFGEFCPEMKLAPSEYFARQCWISYEIDEQTLPALAPFIGEERIVWGSDYPHHDATFPGAVEKLRRTIAPLSTEAQARVIGRNAAQVYGLPPLCDIATVAEAYFSAVKTRRAEAIRHLFGLQAELVTTAHSVKGADAIADFYAKGAFAFDDLRPSPRELQVDGNRVEVTIDLRMDGRDHVVHDRFEIKGTKIERLEVEVLS